MELIIGKIRYILIYKTFIINNIDIERQNIIKFKNENIYINYVINHIKDNILKKYPDLKHIKIRIELFNQDNYIHQFILNIMRKIHKNLSLSKRLILIYIYNDNDLIFVGNINF